jgi:flagellar basal body-associated protein FliL
MSAAAESGERGDVSGNELLLPQSARSGATLKACLQGRRRLSLAIMLGTVALIAPFATFSLWQESPQEVTLELDEATAFHSAPPFIAELKHGKARTHAISLALAVEVPESQKWRLDAHQIAIEDAIRARLRDYDRRELQGNAGADRLRDEILAIVNAAIAPAVASRILFQQFVID